jgi:FAD/FMN-containing dehydrogenase
MLKQEPATNLGTHTLLDNALIEALQERFLGEIIRPSDAGYDDTRTIWNAMIDKYPALIARCTKSDDVIEAVNFARDNNLLLSVRGGGTTWPAVLFATAV